MSRSKFEPSLDTVRKLSLFVLNSLADQPKEWVAVGKAYQELHGFGDDLNKKRKFQSQIRRFKTKKAPSQRQL